MKKKVLRFLSYVAVSVVSIALTATFMTLMPSDHKLVQLENLLLHYFVDGADKTKLEDAAANGMIAALGDRWSYYIPADQYEAFVSNKNNAYVGIGVTVQASERGYLVTQVTENGPAQEAGILPGDILTHADGHSLAGTSTQDGKDHIQGEEGTSVVLTVLRGENTLEITVERRRVVVQVAKGTLLPDGVGLVKILNFNTNCYAATKAEIEKLRHQGATSLVFDVRFNGGGYANEMIQLLDYLLPEGPLFRTEDYSGRVETEYSDGEFLDMPMAVLVNQDSYSAAEFFAAALCEYEAAIIGGWQTSGKGHYQNTFVLADGSAVAISTGRYTTPNGVDLEGVGITPEYAVEVDEATYLGIYGGSLAPEQDPQLQAVIQALKNGK